MTITFHRRGDFYTEVEKVNMTITRTLDYDPSFIMDRFVIEARCGEQIGYSLVRIADGMMDEAYEAVQEQIEAISPGMRRTAIDGALKLGYEDDLRMNEMKVANLHSQIDDLCDVIAALRRPWWVKTYEKVGSWISGVR